MVKSLLVFCVAGMFAVPALAQNQRDTVPPREYYAALRAYQEGDYVSALQGFRSAARGGVRSTEGLWVDSICFHAMMGECFYQLGDLTNSLDQANAAIQLAAFHSDWLLRVQFPDAIEPSASTVRNSITWGVTTRNARLGRIPETMLSLQGRRDNLEAIKRGGVVAAPQLYPLNVKEIVRCTAVALRRRRQIMGPVGPQDPATGQIVAVFSHYATPPNHWSSAWSNCFAGLAAAATGKSEQAAAALSSSLVIGGLFDHELTALALVELGRLNFEQGQYQAADVAYREASYAAAAFEEYDLLEEAFRGALLTHLVSGQQGLLAPLAPASEWSRRRSPGLCANIFLLAAENCAAQGQMAQAVRMLGETRKTVGTRGMKGGLLAVRFHYLSALVGFSQGNLAAGTADLAVTLDFQRKTGSLRLFQIGLADTLFVKGAISQRVADTLFNEVLREPTSADWKVDPLDTLSVVMTPHMAPLEHWFEIAVQRNDVEKALDVAERIRRHRFFSTLPMGGRLLVLRWVLEAPEAALSAAARLQRQDLLARYPGYTKSAAQGAALRQQLNALPLAPEGEAVKQQKRLFEQLAEVSTAQELILREIALRREPAEFVFPPLLSVKEIQAQIPPGQLILSFLVTTRTVTAFALSREKYAAWGIEKPAEVGKLTTELLKQWGLNERKTGVTAALLKDHTWTATAGKLLKLVTANRIETWAPYQELVVVPDGILWYVPFEALTIGDDDNRSLLISKLRVRYVPTLALANADLGDRRPNARTAVMIGKMTPGADLQASVDAFDDLRSKVPNATRFDALPVPSSVFTATCDRMVVFSELEPNPRGPYGWSPTAVERGKAGSSVEDWMALPWQSPAELVLPGFHTPAETGFKRGAGTGTELFLNACALMATGARSVLISRWSPAGQSSFDLLREYVQELPYAPAAEAWKRSVELAGSRQVDPGLEPRVDPSGWDENLKADHPFFWAGYLLLDTGSAPKSDAAK